MALKPWYKTITPREDLRSGQPLDASEFAVQLDQIRDGKGPKVYHKAEEFFQRSFLTKELENLAAQVCRRLSGNIVESAPVVNMQTQFGGGKTHTLALLYHLFRNGSESINWMGVSSILERAGMSAVPTAKIAIFVGTEFDSISGRGGENGSPLRRTPWGEIAWQLGAYEGFKFVAEHDQHLTAPGGDVIEQIFPANSPTLILIDELLNYVSRNRKSGLGSQFYNFLHSLTEAVKKRNNCVLAVSLPASELEMTGEDESDYGRFSKLLGRSSQATLVSEESEITEIIRRRLFQSYDDLRPDAEKIVGQYARWLVQHRNQLPHWFSIDTAKADFANSYPFHPSVISVFKRKWQELPHFQQTRGILRLLALWVSNAYIRGFKDAKNDPLITLGSAPLEDPLFRAAVFEQLGENRLEGAVTTDIVGEKYAHASRLDDSAAEAIKLSNLHQKSATVVFFESNGGQRDEKATLPEVRLAVGGPESDIGTVEQCLDALVESCYFLSVEGTRYWFSFRPNLNKLHADRRATFRPNQIRDRILAETQRVFRKGSGIERIYFPKTTSDVPDVPTLSLVVLDPEKSISDISTVEFIEEIAREHGSKPRTYKSALIWCGTDNFNTLSEKTRSLLAWEAIHAEGPVHRVDEIQEKQLEDNRNRAERDLKESIWQCYNSIRLLNSQNEMYKINLGLVSTTEADSFVAIIFRRLKREDLVVDSVSPFFLVRRWPPALVEWSTKAARDAFFSSPKLPRLSKSNAIIQTISKGVKEGTLAYVGMTNEGEYDPLVFQSEIQETDIEISDDMFLISGETAKEYVASTKSEDTPSTDDSSSTSEQKQSQKSHETESGRSDTTHPSTDVVMGFRWSGEVIPSNWMNFYTRVLASHVNSGEVKIQLKVHVEPQRGVEEFELEELREALRELGMSDEIEVFES